MTYNPLVSIIIPSFQQGLELEGALQSVAQQTNHSYEIIIIDGGSNDNTNEVIAKYSYLPIIYNSETDTGIYDAMNKGIDRSSGKFLYFMGCDDRLASADVLETIFSIPQITDNHVIYGDVIFNDSKDRYNGKFNHFDLYSRNICHQAIFTSRKVFESLGKFDTRYKIYADWEFNMRWFNTYWIRRHYVPIVIAYFNTSGFSSTLQDKIFFAEESNLKEKYFPKIVRYLVHNKSKLMHSRVIKFLTFERINFIKKIINN